MEQHLVRQLGIVALDVDEKLQQTMRLREPSGGGVVARTLDTRGLSGALSPGDAIHGVNRVETGGPRTASW